MIVFLSIIIHDNLFQYTILFLQLQVFFEKIRKVINILVKETDTSCKGVQDDVSEFYEFLQIILSRNPTDCFP